MWIILRILQLLVITNTRMNCGASNSKEYYTSSRRELINIITLQNQIIDSLRADVKNTRTESKARSERLHLTLEIQSNLIKELSTQAFEESKTCRNENYRKQDIDNALTYLDAFRSRASTEREVNEMSTHRVASMPLSPSRGNIFPFQLSSGKNPSEYSRKNHESAGYYQSDLQEQSLVENDLDPQLREQQWNFDELESRFLNFSRNYDNALNILSRTQANQDEILRNIEFQVNNLTLDIEILEEHLDNITVPFEITDKLNRLMTHISTLLKLLQNANQTKSFNSKDNSLPIDCQDLYKPGSPSGVYEIYFNDSRQDWKSHPVFCNMDCDIESGWTVIQRRRYGDQDFRRTWIEFREGFGNVSRDHWLGNEHIHFLTSSKNYTLRVDLEDWEGETRFAIYDLFRVASESEKYKLSIGQYHGDADDALGYHNDQKFSTKDQDNDDWPLRSCCQVAGGFWYKECTYAGLNLNFGTSQFDHGEKSSYDRLNWPPWHGRKYTLKSATMMVKPH